MSSTSSWSVTAALLRVNDRVEDAEFAFADVAGWSFPLASIRRCPPDFERLGAKKTRRCALPSPIRHSVAAEAALANERPSVGMATCRQARIAGWGGRRRPSRQRRHRDRGEAFGAGRLRAGLLCDPW